MAIIQFHHPGARTPGLALRAAAADRLRRYDEYWDYYAGLHFPQGQRRGRTSLSINYARALVDKSVAYLFARGLQFRVPTSGPGAQPVELANRTELALTDLLQRAALFRSLLQAATNASVFGDAVLKICVLGSPPQLHVLNLDPRNFFPTHASDDPTALRAVAVASMVSQEEALERYGLAIGRPAEQLESWTERTLTIQVEGQTVVQAANPYGFIPYLHIANLAPPNTPWGLSDLADVMPLNRELELRISDQSDLIRYHADPPVIFKGVREHSDLAVGPGTVWDVPLDASIELLEWKSQPPAVGEHIERIMRAIYDVSESPRSTFGDTQQPFSGVALETQLQPVIQRTLRRRIVWEPALMELARMTLILAELYELAPGPFTPYHAHPFWFPMLPRDDDAEANRHLALVSGALESHSAAMAALGAPDPAAELAQAKADRELLGLNDSATPAERNNVRFVPSTP